MWLQEQSGAARVGVVEGFGFGAPGAAIVIEELTALGVRRFVNVGLAGALPNDVDFGDVVLCTAAIRDEGVSHHYVPATRYAYPSAGLTDELRQAMLRKGDPFTEGMTWTLDAVYRETVEEALAYREEGVVTVEMEAAALFTIAEVRGVEIASLFTISDHLLADSEWRPAPNKQLLTDGLARILDVALRVLSPEGRIESSVLFDSDVETEGPLLSIESAKRIRHMSHSAVDLFLLDRAMSKLPRLDNTHVSSDIAKERLNSQGSCGVKRAAKLWMSPIAARFEFSVQYWPTTSQVRTTGQLSPST